MRWAIVDLTNVPRHTNEYRRLTTEHKRIDMHHLPPSYHSRAKAFAKQLGEAGEFLWQIKQCYLKFYADKGIFDGFPIHDSTAALALVHPECFEISRGRLVCETQGGPRGRTVLTASEAGPHAVAMAADSEKLTAIFEAAMQAKYGAGSQ